MPQPNVANPFFASAGKYPVQQNSLKSVLCTPPPEGLRFVSMGVDFADQLSWSFDLSQGNPNPPLSQIAALFIDLSLCGHDVYFFVPDSGYAFLVAAGDSVIVPLLSGKKTPQFYCVLAPDLKSGFDELLEVPNDDFMTLIALNQYVPYWNSVFSVKNLNYGIGSLWDQVPDFKMDTVFSGNTHVSAGAGTQNIAIIPNNGWFLKDVDISLTGNTSDGSTTKFTAELLDGSTVIRTKNFLLNAELREVELFKFADFNYETIDGNNLILNITTAGGIMVADIAWNVSGGILKT